MARYTSQKAAQQIGSQFELVLAAAQRARELKAGDRPRVKSTNGPTVTALKEIEEGKYTRAEWFETIQSKKRTHK